MKTPKLNLALTALAVAVTTASIPASATLIVRSAFNNAALSIDGFGGSSGFLQSDVPINSIILKAFLYSSDVNGGGSAGDVTLAGNFLSTASGTLLAPNASPANHLIYDVTSIMKPLIEGTWGLQNHTISEGGFTDGESLVIVYQNASTNGTAIIMDGELSQGGDTTTLNFANPYASGDVIMSLASTYSYNGSSNTNATGQVTNVDVTTSSTAARRLTSCAGGNDDGNFVAQNGALLTVGGVGDSANNPDPNCAGGAGDDELYNLGLGNSANASPFLQAGDTSISFRTNNPSNDDNVYGLFFTSTFQISKVDGGDICGGPNGPVCPPTQVPAPGGLALLGLGLLGLVPALRRRSK